MKKYTIIFIYICKIRLLVIKNLLDNYKNFVNNHVPMGRYGNEGELNAGNIFLASDEASYVTGVILPIDGGYSCV